MSSISLNYDYVFCNSHKVKDKNIDLSHGQPNHNVGI